MNSATPTTTPNQINTVLGRLTQVKAVGLNRWKAKCPAHDDHHPSLSVTASETGRILLNCFAGCNVEDVCLALSLTPAFLSGRTAQQSKGASKIVATYDYHDREGNLLFQVVRTAPKGFYQRRPDGSGGWMCKLKGTEPVLYRLPELMAAPLGEWVLLPEGEKDADRLVGLGFVATTSPMGAGKWRPSYAEVLRGRRVAILPDNDAPGTQHARAVAHSLYGVAAHVAIVELPGVVDKGDVSDWLQNSGTPEQLRGLIDKAPLYRPQLNEQTPSADRPNDVKEYIVTREGIVWWKPTRDGPAPVRLTNFTACIIADVIQDDGVDRKHQFEIEARLAQQRERFVVTAERYATMNWVGEHLGARALVYPGPAIKDRSRAAIQLLSSDIRTRTIYSHVGWRHIREQWLYLHAGGAVGVDGRVDDLEVNLPSALQGYILPESPGEASLKIAIWASLQLTDLVPERIAFPLFCAIWRSVLSPCSFSLHVSGHTGTGKSELAALVLQHWGAGLTAKQLPASWSSTANALEALAFAAQDAILTVDDFAPAGRAGDVQQFHRKADRVLRAQGNRSGRLRMCPDATLRAAKPPRGLIVSTGEDVPRGQSIRARTLVLELGHNDMKWDLLSRCQNNAGVGLYAQSLAGFLRWLAPRLDEIRAQMPSDIAGFRQAATQSGHHKRTPEIVAELATGLTYYLRFTHESGILGSDAILDLWQRGWAALGAAAADQGAQQGASDPVPRFLELLSSALTAGYAHLASPDGGAPAIPSAWGWRRRSHDNWEPQGDRIGWVNGDDLFLDPDASFHTAQQLADHGDGHIAVNSRTLHKRMSERGLLRSYDPSRLTTRQTLDGARRRVLHLHAQALSGAEPGQLGQLGQPRDWQGLADDGGPISGSSYSSSQAENGPANGPQLHKTGQPEAVPGRKDQLARSYAAQETR